MATVIPVIQEKIIIHCAQQAAKYAYNHLISTTAVDRSTAMSASKDAGDHFAQAMSLSLRERGVEIQPEEPLKA